MKDFFVWTGFVLAALLYVPLIVGIWKGEVKQSFTTWILWVALDAIALASVIVQNGNFMQLLIYCIGGSAVWISLLCKKQIGWTWVEWLVLGLVAVCIGVWTLSGAWLATYISTVAVMIAGAPQIKDSWFAAPDISTAKVYLGYTLANLLSALGGKGMSMEEMYYPAMCVPLCIAIAMASLREPKPKLAPVLAEPSAIKSQTDVIT